MLVRGAGGAMFHPAATVYFLDPTRSIDLGSGVGDYAQHLVTIRQIALLGYIKSMIQAADSESAQCMRLKTNEQERKSKQEHDQRLQTIESIEVTSPPDMNMKKNKRHQVWRRFPISDPWM